MVSLGTPRPASAAQAVSLPACHKAANEDLTPAPQNLAEPSARVPLSAWLSLAFYAIGTALLFSLGVAYRLFA
jgi:hypothetical protein